MEKKLVPPNRKFLKKYGKNFSFGSLIILSNRNNMIFYTVNGVMCINLDTWQKFERKLVRREIEEEIKKEIKKGVRELADTLINEAFQEIKREAVKKEVKILGIR